MRRKSTISIISVLLFLQSLVLCYGTYIVEHKITDIESEQYIEDELSKEIDFVFDTVSRPIACDSDFRSIKEVEATQTHNIYIADYKGKIIEITKYINKNESYDFIFDEHNFKGSKTSYIRSIEGYDLCSVLVNDDGSYFFGRNNVNCFCIYSKQNEISEQDLESVIDKFVVMSENEDE